MSRTRRSLRDWTRFIGVRSKYTFEERVERKKRKYKREKLRSGRVRQIGGDIALIIPFPSMQANADNEAENSANDA